MEELLEILLQVILKQDNQLTGYILMFKDQISIKLILFTHLMFIKIKIN